MAWVQVADGEENDESDWDVVTETDSATLDVSADAKKNGSYGWKVTLTAAGETAYGHLDDPTNETEFRAELWINRDNLTMANGDWFVLHQCNGSGAVAVTYDVRLIRSGANYYCNAIAYNDASGGNGGTYVLLAAGWNKIGIAWKASSAPGANDGYFRVYLDEVCKVVSTGLDNDTYDIDTAFFGAIGGVDAGTSGYFYMDDCQWNSEPNYFSTPDTAKAFGQVVVPTCRFRSTPDVARAISQVDPGITRIKEIVANVTRAIAQVSALGTHGSFVTKILRALFRKYTLIAPEHIEIESSKGVLVAPFKDYYLIADKRETI